ncbi:MAG: hypothetical protein ACTS77_03705, partial [Arsenophonus sp. NC-TX2-MAG3]
IIGMLSHTIMEQDNIQQRTRKIYGILNTQNLLAYKTHFSHLNATQKIACVLCAVTEILSI